MAHVDTKELSGFALDWAVGKIEGQGLGAITGEMLDIRIKQGVRPCPYSTSWDEAGAIIEREGIDLHQTKSHPFGIFSARHFDPSRGDVLFYDDRRQCQMVRRPSRPGAMEGKWCARMSVDYDPFGWSPVDFMSDTPLVSAMRCYVASRLGQNIKVPDAVLAMTGNSVAA